MRVKIILLIAGVVLWGGCTHIYTAKGVHYRVQKGDTLASIAQKFHAETQELAELNNIENPEELKVGRSVYIPGVTPSGLAGIINKERRVTRREPSREKDDQETKEVATAALVPGEAKPLIQVDHGRFHWPLEGELSSLFGMRRGRRHDGVDIRARQGTPVGAAADGEVVFSKRLRGYGNLILVKHKEDFFTVYGHNSVNLVKKGTKVKKGQTIAKVGRTGRATGPHLHFEVREGTRARNPLFFLPKTQFAQKARERGKDYGGPDGEIAGEDQGHP